MKQHANQAACLKPPFNRYRWLCAPAIGQFSPPVPELDLLNAVSLIHLQWSFRHGLQQKQNGLPVVMITLNNRGRWISALAGVNDYAACAKAAAVNTGRAN
ncbi:MAG TPA: hypothetical protein VG962_12475 [Steroidobacteraceae bacterium]|jgi:hypothetical protein|nr:hypothetical protein [Steroidobacteraceae bacterium]